MGQCQLILKDNEKNLKKNSIPLRFEDMRAQKSAAVISFMLNIKKKIDYLSIISLWYNSE
jgi:hypothetical protein